MRHHGDPGSHDVLVACVGAIVRDPEGRLLLILRGHPPAAGCWSLPGGRVEPGESDTAAVIREVAEETGLVVSVGALIGTVIQSPYRINDYAATVTGGALQAGDDAHDVGWVAPADLPNYPLTDGLIETLRGWGQL